MTKHSTDSVETEYMSSRKYLGLPRWYSHKESTYQCNGCRFDPWVGNIPWSRKWPPAPVFLPGKSHGQKSLAGFRLWGCRVGHSWATEHTENTWHIIRISRIIFSSPPISPLSVSFHFDNCQTNTERKHDKTWSLSPLQTSKTLTTDTNLTLF